jgi:hypothetical protein
MKNYNNFEIILNSNHFLPEWRQRELANWLITIVQPFIGIQELVAKKMSISSLKYLPPIHMS